MFSLVLMVNCINSWKHSVQHSIGKNVWNTAHVVNNKVCEHGADLAIKKGQVEEMIVEK